MVQVRLGLRDCLTHFSLPFSCVDLRRQQLANGFERQVSTFGTESVNGRRQRINSGLDQKKTLGERQILVFAF